MTSAEDKTESPYTATQINNLHNSDKDHFTQTYSDCFLLNKESTVAQQVSLCQTNTRITIIGENVRR